MQLNDFTIKQLLRIKARLILRAYAALTGGTQYGVDMRTLTICLPRTACWITRIQTEVTRRYGVMASQPQWQRP